MKIATAQLYSTLYYASPVWLNRTFKALYWTKIRSLHYRILRSAVKDYKKKVSRESIRQTLQESYSRYIVQVHISLHSN